MDDGRLRRANAQGEMWSLVGELAPACIEQLDERVTGAWERARTADPNGSHPAWGLRHWSYLCDPLAREKLEVRELAEAVLAWSSRWHLGADWVRDRALHTVERWVLFPPARERLELAHAGLSYESGLTWDPSVDALTWDPYVKKLTWDPYGEPKSQAERRLIAARVPRSVVREFLELVAGSGGWASTRALPKLRTRLVWLVRYQVLGESCGQIADSEIHPPPIADFTVVVCPFCSAPQAATCVAYRGVPGPHEHRERAASSSGRISDAARRRYIARRNALAESISDEIEDTAILVGLTRRAPNPPGRPRKE